VSAQSSKSWVGDKKKYRGPRNSKNQTLGKLYNCAALDATCWGIRGVEGKEFDQAKSGGGKLGVLGMEPM